MVWWQGDTVISSKEIILARKLVVYDVPQINLSEYVWKRKEEKNSKSTTQILQLIFCLNYGEDHVTVVVFWYVKRFFFHIQYKWQNFRMLNVFLNYDGLKCIS